MIGAQIAEPLHNQAHFCKSLKGPYHHAQIDLQLNVTIGLDYWQVTTADICVMQVDNPLRAATYPVLCTAPAAFSTFSAMTEAFKAASQLSAPSALCLRTAVWLRRPGGVLCIEGLQL